MKGRGGAVRGLIGSSGADEGRYQFISSYFNFFLFILEIKYNKRTYKRGEGWEVVRRRWEVRWEEVRGGERRLCGGGYDLFAFVCFDRSCFGVELGGLNEL